MRPKRKTLFPVTHFDFSAENVARSSLRFQDGLNIAAYFNTRQTSVVALIEEANRLTIGNGWSPYRSWAEVMDHDIDDIQALMDLPDGKTVDFYLDNPHLSPAPYHVYAFCDSLKINPVYIRPCVDPTENEYRYDRSILFVLVDLTGDPETPEADRRLFIEALRTERDRLRSYEFKDCRQDFGYLGQARELEKKVRAETKATDGFIEKFLPPETQPADIATCFLKLHRQLSTDAVKGNVQERGSAQDRLAKFGKWLEDPITLEKIIPMFEDLELIETCLATLDQPLLQITRSAPASATPK